MSEAVNERLVREAVAQLRQGLDERFDMHLRVARRVTLVIRVGMVSLAAVAVAMLLLVFTLSFHVKDMLAAVDSMNVHFTSIAKDMGSMRATLAEMDAQVATLPVMVSSVTEMRGSVEAMKQNMAALSEDMTRVNGDMGVIRGDVVRMAHTFSQLNGTVHGMGVDINRMSGPMKPFNAMTP